MEPFKALTFLAAAGVVSLVGAGAAGFYAGYTGGRALQGAIEGPAVSISGGGGGSTGAASAVSLKPVRDDIRALSKQVEALAAIRPVAGKNQSVKPVLDEIKSLSHQLEGLKPGSGQPQTQQAFDSKPLLDEIKSLTKQIRTLKASVATDQEPNLKPILNEIKALSRRVEISKSRTAAAERDQLRPVINEIKDLGRQVEALKAASRSEAGKDDGGKAVLQEIKALSRQVEAFRNARPNRGAEGLSAPVVPDYTEALHNIRELVTTLNTKFDKQEPKAPKALLDEIRTLSASIQAQESVARRAVAAELRTAVAALRDTETKFPKGLVQEIHTIAANTRPSSQPKPSSADQIKVLTASIESLKTRLARNSGSASVANQVAKLHRLLAQASDQFTRCQTQLASLPAGGGQAQTQQRAVSQRGRQPSTVVFYDNVMLKKNQEKQYDEIGVKLALQAIGPRQVKVAVNRQGVGLAFGERKVFRSQDVECELNLMETNLNEAQARVSISCKR